VDATAFGFNSTNEGNIPMEYGVITFVALFTMIFGQLFAARLVDIAFTLVDKTIDNAGALMMLPFRISAMVFRALFKGFVLGLKGLCYLISTRKPETRKVHTVVEILEVTPLTLQHLRNQRFLNAQPKVHPGLLIEQSPD
jgi:hypothetical protein